MLTGVRFSRSGDPDHMIAEHGYSAEELLQTFYQVNPKTRHS